jgi:hypothetical protein
MGEQELGQAVLTPPPIFNILLDPSLGSAKFRSDEERRTARPVGAGEPRLKKILFARS